MRKEKIKELYDAFTLWYDVVFFSTAFLLFLIELIFWRDIKTALVGLLLLFILGIPRLRYLYKRRKSEVKHQINK